MRKRSALDSFHDNLNDAYLLVSLASALTNSRQRRMRREKREAVGQALRLNRVERDRLDCVESDDFFVVIKPDSAVNRRDLSDVRPLLRQALVAGAAAVETYVADRIMEFVGSTLRQEDLPRNLKEVSLSVEDYYRIAAYKRRGWGLRRVIHEHVQKIASLSPSQIGRAFALVGQDQVMRRVDKERGLKIGTSTSELNRIYERRNQIAHSADRAGRGRATLTVNDVHRDLKELEAVVEIIEKITGKNR